MLLRLLQVENVWSSAESGSSSSSDDDDDADDTVNPSNDDTAVAPSAPTAVEAGGAPPTLKGRTRKRKAVAGEGGAVEKRRRVAPVSLLERPLAAPAAAEGMTPAFVRTLLSSPSVRFPPLGRQVAYVVRPSTPSDGPARRLVLAAGGGVASASPAGVTTPPSPASALTGVASRLAARLSAAGLVAGSAVVRGVPAPGPTGARAARPGLATAGVTYAGGARPIQRPGGAVTAGVRCVGAVSAGATPGVLTLRGAAVGPGNLTLSGGILAGSAPIAVGHPAAGATVRQATPRPAVVTPKSDAADVSSAPIAELAVAKTVGVPAVGLLGGVTPANAVPGVGLVPGGVAGSPQCFHYNSLGRLPPVVVKHIVKTQDDRLRLAAAPPGGEPTAAPPGGDPTTHPPTALPGGGELRLLSPQKAPRYASNVTVKALLEERGRPGDAGKPAPIAAPPGGLPPQLRPTCVQPRPAASGGAAAMTASTGVSPTSPTMTRPAGFTLKRENAALSSSPLRTRLMNVQPSPSNSVASLARACVLPAVVAPRSLSASVIAAPALAPPGTNLVMLSPRSAGGGSTVTLLPRAVSPAPGGGAGARFTLSPRNVLPGRMKIVRGGSNIVTHLPVSAGGLTVGGPAALPRGVFVLRPQPAPSTRPASSPTAFLRARNSAPVQAAQTAPAMSKIILYNVGGQLMTADGIPVSLGQGVVRVPTGRLQRAGGDSARLPTARAIRLEAGPAGDTPTKHAYKVVGQSVSRAFVNQSPVIVNRSPVGHPAGGHAFIGHPTIRPTFVAKSVISPSSVSQSPVNPSTSVSRSPACQSPVIPLQPAATPTPPSANNLSRPAGEVTPVNQASKAMLVNQASKLTPVNHAPHVKQQPLRTANSLPTCDASGYDSSASGLGLLSQAAALQQPVCTMAATAAVATDPQGEPPH